MLVLVFALLPGRMRTFAVLVPVAAGIAAAAPAVLRVGDHLRDGRSRPRRPCTARSPRRSPQPPRWLRGRRSARRVESGAAVARQTRSARARRASARSRSPRSSPSLAGGSPRPATRCTASNTRWDTLQGRLRRQRHRQPARQRPRQQPLRLLPRGARRIPRPPASPGSARTTSSSSTSRHGRSEETPRYPHSVELRTLVPDRRARRAARARRPRRRAAGRLARAAAAPIRSRAAVAAAALAGFAYWARARLVDWFWEFAGLGAPAFALLGLACALAPARAAARSRRRPPSATAAPPRARATPRALARARRSPAWRPGCSWRVRAARCRSRVPWLSQLQVQSAARVWTTARRTAAYARLDDAASLNPLSDEAYLVAGSIALRYGELRPRRPRVRRWRCARTPGDAYATLERGAIASQRRATARRRSRCSTRAVELNPRDALAARSACARARRAARERRGTQPLDPAQSSATRLNCRMSIHVNAAKFARQRPLASLAFYGDPRRFVCSGARGGSSVQVAGTRRRHRRGMERGQTLLWPAKGTQGREA